MRVLHWAGILVAALEAVHDIYQRDHTECANHPLSEDQRRHGIRCSDSLSLMAGYDKYKKGLVTLEDLGWSKVAFDKWENAFRKLQERESKNGLTIPTDPELGISEAAPVVIFLIAYCFQENLAWRVGRKYLTKDGLQVQISSRSIMYEEDGEALVSLAYGRGEDGVRPWATVVQVSFITKEMWVLLENTEHIGPVIDKAPEVQNLVQGARRNAQIAMSHLMEDDGSVAKWLKPLLGMHLLPSNAAKDLHTGDTGDFGSKCSESQSSSIPPSAIGKEWEEDDSKNAMDTTWF